MNNPPILSLTGVSHSFPLKSGCLPVLHEINLAIRPGEIVALAGSSGSGKSTLLQICGLLEKPSVGDVIIDGTPTQTISDMRRTAIRRDTIGFVYQFHHLLPEFSALENVMLPQLIKNDNVQQSREHALSLIEAVGLANRVDHRPSQLSGGEQQRIAIARAIANSPKLLLADEPTGNLDSKNAENVFHTLLELAEKHKIAALIATHNTEMARRMHRLLKLIDGKLIEEG